jgi:biotin carboxyl carrier protein
MKLKAQFLDNECEIWLDFDNGRVSAEIEGRDYEIAVRELAGDASDPGSEYLLLHGSDVYKCRVAPKSDSTRLANSFAANLRGHAYDVTIVDPKRLRSGHSSAAHDHGEVQIVSPMPGKIVRVLVEAGAQVEAGAGIVIVEAMKMQNEMKAPKAGVVISIKTEAGATVNAGDVLAVIE